MIKKLVILIAFGMVCTIWASEPVTVQVISAIYEKSITHEFDARLKKTGLEIHKKIEANRYVVTLGTYKDEKSAQSALKKARALVAKDAFIRPVNRHYSVEHAKVTPETHTVATEHVVMPSDVVAAAPTAAVATVANDSSKLVVLSDCDRREMHKDELAEAINYYKNSPYHRFEPVLLRR
jgi:hypothetical protein